MEEKVSHVFAMHCALSTLYDQSQCWLQMKQLIVPCIQHYKGKSEKSVGNLTSQLRRFILNRCIDERLYRQGLHLRMHLLYRDLQPPVGSKSSKIT
jgi:hypothetical protein